MKNTKKTIYLVMLIPALFFLNSGVSQIPIIEWQNTIGGSGSDYLFATLQTEDGGFILSGHSYSGISGDKTEANFGLSGTNDYWIVKTNSLGIIEWQNTIGGANLDYLHCVKTTTDGGYILAGYSNSGISGDKTESSLGGYDYWVVKLNSIGVIQWQNTIGGSADDIIYSFETTSDGGYILGGYSSSGISGDKIEPSLGLTDYWVVKLNSVGTIQWQNTIGGSDGDYLYSIKQTFDGGYILGGYSLSPFSGDKTESTVGSSDYWVVKLNSTGSIEWQNNIGGSGSDYLYAIDQTIDGGYILGGHSSSNISGDKTENNHGSGDYWVIKLNIMGGIQWQNTIGGDNIEFLYSLEQTYDGGYLLGGYSQSAATYDKTESTIGAEDYWIVKLNSIGEIIWQNDIGGSGLDKIRWVTQTTDLGYIVAGFSASNTSIDKNEASKGSYDFWLIKLSTDNCNLVPYYVDADDDDFGTGFSIGNACEAPGVYFSLNNIDCDDLCENNNPSAVELCDNIDNNCDGEIDEGLIECIPANLIAWQNTIGGNLDDVLLSMEEINTGGFILGGTSYSGISGDKSEVNLGYGDYWVVETNSLGNIVWQNTIGGNSDDYLVDIKQTNDGGFILGGISYSGVSGDKTETNRGAGDYWIVKIDPLGNIEWQKTLGGSSEDYLFSIDQTDDNGFIIGGMSISDISGDKVEASIGGFDYWVVKVDSAGVIQWQNTIGGNADDGLSVIKQTLDGGYIIGGASDSGISGDKTENRVGATGTSDYWVVKLDTLGNIVWQNTIGGSLYDDLTSLEQTNDGGYIVGGISSSGISGDKTESSMGGSDYWIIKLTITGNVEWQNTIGGSANDALYDLHQTMDGGYIVGGSSSSGITGDKTEEMLGGYVGDYWVVKLDASGLIIWQNTIGSNGNDDLQSVWQTSDGGYILGGYSSSGELNCSDKNEFGTGSDDIWIVKLNPDCTPIAEVCNTLDDNCNGIIDEDVIESIIISAVGPTTFCQGGSVILSATYTGTTVQWKKNGVNIPGATLSSYTVNQKATYTCQTSSACGSTISTGIYVNVTKNPSASISADGLTTFCPGGSVTLIEVPSPGCTYQWYKGATALVGATSTSYTATVSGNFKCRVTKAATGCYKNSNTISVSATCKEGEIISDLIVYPNPTKDILIIEFSEINKGTIEITNIAGQIIFMEKLNDSRMEIKVSEYAVGMYILKFISEENEMVAKFIKE